MLPLEYDEIGCVVGTQSDVAGTNVVVIPQYEAIVIGQNKKYSIISSQGEIYVHMILDSVYSQTVNGEEKYSMNFTRQVEEDGKIVDKRYTYDVDEYFKQEIIETPGTLEENVNNIGNSGNETIDTNTVAADSNTQVNTNVA